jgi:small subunit ribosomal protein S9
MTTNRPFYYGLGKRKTAIARVRLFEQGKGECSVNGAESKDYFYSTLLENALAPTELTELLKKLDLEVFVEGGGKVAQSDAMRLGISRALILINPELRTMLKQAGFLRRDSRIKERKKPGLKRARRAPQFSKR